MRVVLKTKVVGHYRDIMKRFDQDLFLALAPKLAKIKLEQFTGSETGDIVHIKFLFPVKTEWISDIVDHGADDRRAYFVDRARVIPFPFSTWEHHHIIEKIDEHHSYIIDDMRFTGKNVLFNYLLYPAVFFGFLPRKRIYKRYFG